MMCSADELGMGGDHSGLLILSGQPALGTPIAQALPPGDTVFDIEITPNRPDCQCHLGIARELAAWFKLPLVYPQEKFRGEVTGAARSDLLAGVEVQAPEDCPLYLAHVITGVKIGPSPEWLRATLEKAGIRLRSKGRTPEGDEWFRIVPSYRTAPAEVRAFGAALGT